jgi:hypothetical protein
MAELMQPNGGFADLTSVVGLPDVERLEARFAAG